MQEFVVYLVVAVFLGGFINANVAAQGRSNTKKRR